MHRDSRTMVKISIIIPAYNQGSYLGQAIDSVLAQNFQDFEVLVIDDGSTDETCDVVTGYLDPRVHYIYQDNKGLSGARNTGIAHATAPYLLFLDADDCLRPQALSLHCKAVQDCPGTALNVGGWVLTDDQRNQISDQSFPPDSVSFTYLLNGNAFPVHSVLVQRRWLDKVGFFDETLRACEDWDLWLRVTMAGGQVSTHRQVICEYRTHPGQMTKQVERMRTAMITVLDKIFSDEMSPEITPKLKNQAYAAAYVKAAARAFHAMDLSDAQQDLGRAVELDPELLQVGSGSLIQLLTSWAYASSTVDPLEYLDRVYSHLPDNLKMLHSDRRRNLGQMAMDLAFRAYQKRDYAMTRHFAWRAFCYQPGWLQNRGSLSIFIRSCLAL